MVWLVQTKQFSPQVSHTAPFLKVPLLQAVHSVMLELLHSEQASEHPPQVTDPSALLTMVNPFRQVIQVLAFEQLKQSLEQLAHDAPDTNWPGRHLEQVELSVQAMQPGRQGRQVRLVRSRNYPAKQVRHMAVSMGLQEAQEGPQGRQEPVPESR